MTLDRDPLDISAAQVEADRILRRAREQAAQVRAEVMDEVEAKTRRQVEAAERQIADRRARADREAGELRRESVVAAAELMLRVREEAERVSDELATSARAEADRLARERIIDADIAARERMEAADTLARARLLEAEVQARAILDRARVDAEPSPPEVAPPPPPPADQVVPGAPPPPAGEGRGSSPAAPAAAARRPRPRVPRTLKVVAIVVLSVIGADVVRGCVAVPFTVASTSMEPELHDGNRVVVDKFVYRFGDVGRGDVVVIDTGELDTEERLADSLVKRVIARPGETVESVAGQVRVDGEPLDEPYLHGSGTPDFGPVTVPDDAVFVLGDNRVVSVDSRTFGPVPKHAIVGRVDAVIWPLSDLGPV